MNRILWVTVCGLAALSLRPTSGVRSDAPVSADPAPMAHSVDPNTRPTSVTDAPPAHESPGLQRAPIPAPPFHWSQVESTNYVDYIANLRRIGCPAATVRDIIRADLDQALHRDGADRSGQTQWMLEALLGDEAGEPVASAPANHESATPVVVLRETAAIQSESSHDDIRLASASAEQGHPGDTLPMREDSFHQRHGARMGNERNLWETLSMAPDGEGDSPLFIEEGEDSGFAADDVLNPDGTVGLPLKAIRAVAARHTLSESKALTAWLSIHLAGSETSATVTQLLTLARELAGDAAFAELEAIASVKTAPNPR